MQQMSKVEFDPLPMETALAWLNEHRATVSWNEGMAVGLTEIAIEVPSQPYDRTAFTVVERRGLNESPSDWFLRAVARAQRTYEAASGA